MSVSVVPLKVFAVPVKVCTAAATFCAVKVVAVLVKFPPKEKSAAAPVVVSFQTAPLFNVTSPVKVIRR